MILSPLYRLWPRAEFLLALQAVWCGAGVIAVYLIGRYQLGSRAWGLIWAVVYALHPALHGANLWLSSPQRQLDALLPNANEPQREESRKLAARVRQQIDARVTLIAPRGKLAEPAR